MAVVKGPLMSIDATGPVGKTIVMSHWKGRNVVRKLVKPKNPRSGLQKGMRAMFQFTSQNFKNLTALQVSNWAAKAKPFHITPLNQQQRVNQKNARINLGYVSDPTNVSAGIEAAPTTNTAVAQTKSIKLTWVDSVGAHDVATLIFINPTTATPIAIGNLIAVVAHGVQVFTIKGLTTGTLYHVNTCGSDWAGIVSTGGTDVNATPT